MKCLIGLVLLAAIANTTVGKVIDNNEPNSNEIAIQTKEKTLLREIRTLGMMVAPSVVRLIESILEQKGKFHSVARRLTQSFGNALQDWIDWITGIFKRPRKTTEIEDGGQREGQNQNRIYAEEKTDAGNTVFVIPMINQPVDYDDLDSAKNFLIDSLVVYRKWQSKIHSHRDKE